MPLDSDLLIDRRRLKRRLTLWRVLAILAAVAAIFIALSFNKETAPLIGFRPQIARVDISGFISTSRERSELLKKLKDDDNVRAVLVHIDSPGGSTSGGEALYEDLRALAKKKPVAAVFGTAATSAAYLAGIATDYIVARGNTITGSVGVIFQWAQISSLLDKIGVKVEEVRSGPLKANPSLFEPADEQAKQLTQDLVHEAEGWFSGLVAERRPAVQPTMAEIRTGRIYTGRQALNIGLIDAIGDEKTAIAWFEQKRGVPKDLTVVDWKPESSEGSRFWRAAVTHIAQAAGISTLESTILSEVNPLGSRPLDGLLSIWHPQLGK
jgi:protease-4